MSVEDLLFALYTALSLLGQGGREECGFLCLKDFIEGLYGYVNRDLC